MGHFSHPLPWCPCWQGTDTLLSQEDDKEVSNRGGHSCQQPQDPFPQCVNRSIPFSREPSVNVKPNLTPLAAPAVFGMLTADTASDAKVETMLSHTWVRYPGFSSHGVKCPILTTVVPGFYGDLIGCTIRSKWGPFGDLSLARKNLLFVWNKLFLGEIKFSQRRTRPVKSLWWQIVPMQESTNEWKNLTIF